MIIISKIKDITGQQFGRLIALKPEYDENGMYTGRWICRCKCGTIIAVRRDNLINGNTRSCGCLFQERGTAWVFEFPEYDAIIFVCKNNARYFFVADAKDMHLLDEFSWTALKEQGRIKPVTWIKGDQKRRYHTFGQVKLSISHGDPFECDHINHRVNDFRSCNIRRATPNQNKCNTPKSIGQIKKDAVGFYLVFPDAYTGEKFILPERYATKKEAEAAKKKWLDDSADYRDFTYWNSQRISRENAFYYNSWVVSLNEKPTKHDKLVEEISHLSEQNPYKILFRRLHGWYQDLMHGRSIKFGDYEINGICVNGRDMPLVEETCYLKMLEIIDEYAKSKKKSA